MPIPHLTSGGRAAAAAALLAALPLVTWPGEAAACFTPSPPQVTGSLPREGQPWPLNAAVFIDGSGITPDIFSAKVNGSPVSLSVDERLSSGASSPYVDSRLALRFDPPLAEGDAVRLYSDACHGACEGFELNFTAGPAQTFPAPEAPGLSFDVATWDGSQYIPGLCQEVDWLEVAWFVDLTEIPPIPDGDELSYLIERRTGEGPWGKVATVYASSSPEAASATFVDTSEEARDGAGYADNTCVRVTALSKTGVAATPVEVCHPCHLRHLVDGAQGWESYVIEVPDEPRWTDPYRFCGGPCDSGPSCTADGVVEDDGIPPTPTPGGMPTVAPEPTPTVAPTLPPTPTFEDSPTPTRPSTPTLTPAHPSSPTPTSGDDDPPFGCDSSGGGGGLPALMALALGLALRPRRGAGR